MNKIAKLLTVLLFVIGFATICTEQVEAKESKDYVIKVNVGTNCVTIYKDDKPVKAMICSPSNETPIGTFYTPVKYRWHEMIGNCYAQYCTRITGGILFHSVWYYRNGDKSSMSVAAYNVMGNKASHGCVRLLCEDAKWIYDNCALKTKVIIFKGDKDDDPLGRPSFTPIKTGAFMSWDPTDPDPKNPYQKAKPTITVEKTTIEYNSKDTAESLVEFKDSLGNVLTKENAKIKIKGKINTKKLGKYEVTYKVTDERDNEREETVTFEVVDTKKPKIYGAKKRKNIAVGETVKLRKGVTAKMVSGKKLTSKVTVKVVNNSTKKKVKVKEDMVTFKKAGNYSVTYKVTGTNKITAMKTVKYTVVDKRVAVKMAAKKVKIKYGSKFEALSYVKSIRTHKNKTLKINSSNVTVEGNVDTLKPGTYKLTYTLSHKGKEFTKTVKKLTVVVDNDTTEKTTSTGSETVTGQTTVSQTETTTNPQAETTTSEEETTTVEEITSAEETTTVEETTSEEETTAEEETTEEETTVSEETTTEEETTVSE